MVSSDPRSDRQPPAAEEARPRRRWLWWGMALVGLVMAGAISSLVFSLMGTIHQQNQIIGRSADSLRIAASRESAFRRESEEALTALGLATRGARVIPLQGSVHCPLASGALIVDPDSGRILLLVTGVPGGGDRFHLLVTEESGEVDSLGSFALSDTLPHMVVFRRTGLPAGRVVVRSGLSGHTVLMKGNRQ